jgi:trans-aconitate methyltransferase
MTQSWRDVWGQRRLPDGKPVDLQNLLRLDGYDTAVSRVDTNSWRQYVGAIIEQLGLSDGSSVYEVGCGAGALLYGLRERSRIDVGGCDFSAPLVSVARRAIPNGDFIVSDATEFPQSPSYDTVVSGGVFHYFPDFSYAARALERMAAKAERAVVILDVPDEATREASEVKRREMLSPEEYEQKYRGLDHLYFPRCWFRNISEALSMKCNFLDIKLPGYAQNSFRFGVMLTRES